MPKLDPFSEHKTDSSGSNNDNERPRRKNSLGRWNTEEEPCCYLSRRKRRADVGRVCERNGVESGGCQRGDLAGGRGI
jgi:hypothetical protein